MKQIPLISVIMPVFNTPEFYLVQSISSILRQTRQDFELIIVDDGSSFQTRKILKKFLDKKIHVIYNKKHIGLTHSLNIGLKTAKGAFIARQDGDDVSTPERFEKQLAYFKSHPDVGLVYSWVRLVNPQGTKVGALKSPKYHSEIVKQLIYKNPIRHSSVMFKRNLVDNYGTYDEKMDGAEDYDLWLRFAQKTHLACIQEELVDYRLLASGVSYSQSRKVERAFYNVKLKSIQKYHYPKWHYLFCLKSIISLNLPSSIKKHIYHSFLHYS